METFTVMSSPKVIACSNESTTTDSTGYNLDAIIENELIKTSEKNSEPNEICSMEMLANFEIPEPIQALDNILSQFEEPESLPFMQGSYLHENHSEDDGYMSLNGRRCDINNTNLQQESSTCTTGNSQDMPNALINSGKIDEDGDKDPTNSNKPSAPHNQNTIPKTKSKICTKSNYSSLPCSSLRSNLVELDSRIGSCRGNRNTLGIDISAVHNAVLRGGVPKLPEPIVNEHPITIYPGRKSPNWSARASRAAFCTIQAQQENCYKIKNDNLNPHPLPSVRKAIAFSKENLILNNKSQSKENIVKYENEVSKFGDSDLRELSNINMLSHDVLSKESHFPSQLLAISAPATPQKLNSIAWEINFCENKRTAMAKKKKRSRDNCLKKNTALGKSSNYKKGENSAKDTDKECASDKRVSSPKSNILTSHNDKLLNDISETNNISVTHKIEDNINNQASTYDSMLGKGTFIIRKRQVQSTRCLNLAEPLRVQCQNGETAPTENNGYHESLDVSPHFKVSVRNSARGRLSLDLEPEHLEGLRTNQLGHYKSPQQKESTPKIYAEEQCSDFYNAENVTQSYSTTSINNAELENLKDLELNIELNCSEANATPLEISRKTKETFIKVDKSDVIHLIHNQGLVKVSNDLRSPGTTEHKSSCNTPHRELAPPLEEEEEQCSESQSGCAPLRQIEHNISALLRGDIAVIRSGDSCQSRRSLNYRPGVHKSESAKEMLLSQNAFGPLPPSPPSSSPEINDCDSLPPLPPSPSGTDIDDNILDTESIFTPIEIHSARNTHETSELQSKKGASKYQLNNIPLPPLPHERLPPAVPPHRGSTHFQTIRSRSIDSNYTRKFPMAIPHSGSSVISTVYTPSACDPPFTSRRNIGSYGNKRSVRQSPREEHRLQTSCSLPETPIFSRGCDIARTPHKRQTENTIGSGSRTAPRSCTSQASSMGSSIVGISGGNTLGVGVCRQRSISHALASGEMLRLSGGPARGWYPKQRSMRPASTEHIDRLPQSHSASMRVWDSAGGMTGSGQIRKPLTLPPNLTPSFLNKSPREALRRVTSLLINKKGSAKDREHKISKENLSQATVELGRGIGPTCKITLQEAPARPCNKKSVKKKGFFKQFWKKSKHFSLEQ